MNNANSIENTLHIVSVEVNQTAVNGPGAIDAEFKVEVGKEKKVFYVAYNCFDGERYAVSLNSLWNEDDWDFGYDEEEFAKEYAPNGACENFGGPCKIIECYDSFSETSKSKFAAAFVELEKIVSGTMSEYENDTIVPLDITLPFAAAE